MKRCLACKDDLDESFFGKNKSTKSGLHWMCKDCQKKTHKRWGIKAGRYYDPIFGGGTYGAEAIQRAKRSRKQNEIVKYGIDVVDILRGSSKK